MHCEDDEFVCDECGKYFSSRNHMKRHKLIHGEKKFECPKCDLKFHRSDHLKSHLQNHDNFYYQCQCGWKYSRLSILKQHQINSNHGEIVKTEEKKKLDKKNYDCNECDMKFIAQTAFNSHLRAHENFRVECNGVGCKMKFSTAKSLRRHKLRAQHESFKQFPCNKCDLKFTRINDLNRHLKAHNSFKFLCSCEQRYSCIGNLKFHQEHSGHFNWAKIAEIKKFPIKTSTIIQPVKNFIGSAYYCHLCEIDLHWRSSYLRHMKNHKNFRYKCGCDQRFSIKKTLMMHQKKTNHSGYKFIRKTTSIRPNLFIRHKDAHYLCVKCDKKFIFYGNYFRHIQNHRRAKDDGRKIKKSNRIHEKRCEMTVKLEFPKNESSEISRDRVHINKISKSFTIIKMNRNLNDDGVKDEKSTNELLQIDEKTKENDENVINSMINGRNIENTASSSKIDCKTLKRSFSDERIGKKLNERDENHNNLKFQERTKQETMINAKSIEENNTGNSQIKSSTSNTHKLTDSSNISQQNDDKLTTSSYHSLNYNENPKTFKQSTQIDNEKRSKSNVHVKNTENVIINASNIAENNFNAENLLNSSKLNANSNSNKKRHRDLQFNAENSEKHQKIHKIKRENESSLTEVENVNKSGSKISSTDSQTSSLSHSSKNNHSSSSNQDREAKNYRFMCDDCKIGFNDIFLLWKHLLPKK